ncbi:MAG: FAD-dependent oxidoreductase, partial [Thermodesulfobacteriota bacterium]|nr:FAD-dependent oxidoreductase [Thermodesulfobacteriota bacterium]
GRHINIELHTCTNVENIDGKEGDFQVFLRKSTRYIDPDKCTACGDCAYVCPVERPDEYNKGLAHRKAIYKSYPQAIPGGFSIEKLDTAPCRMSCPAHLNVQGYVAMVKTGRYREAIEIIMQDLPFPGVLGRICPHKCEKSCRRLEIDEAISIRELKRVAADHVKLLDIPVPEIIPKDEKAVIIGSGPAGLTAAYFLALDGYKVSVYEAMPEAGGMMRYGIPEHRLPRSVLDGEIENLKRFGIEIYTNTVIGRDISIEDLREHGAKAVFLATGAWKGLKLRIPGEDTPEGISDVTSFLRDVHLGNIKQVKGKAVIIGGGHSALDGARLALRLGAKETHIIYRRSRTEMLAEPEEISEAEKEGIKIHFLVAPLSITGKNGKVDGIECIRTRLTEPDTAGRRKPVPIEGSEFFIEADHIIPAIGQEPDFEPLGENHGLVISRWNFLEVNPETLQTNIDGIFAGGDVVTGPATVIEAVEAGKRAAKYMALYMQGGKLPTEWQEDLPMGDNWTKLPRDEPSKKRVQVPTLSVDKRISGFEEVNLTIDEKAAQGEAERCLNCGGCCECYQCVSACKAGAVTFETHKEKGRIVSINVGSMILTPGLETFDPSGLDVYKLKEFPNVITSIEFERLLSAGGPTTGHVLRPSDNKEPQNIAWLQCVGSRDLNRCDNEYCSSVCCMYAIKEALIAKEHIGNSLETTIFFMDIRTHGKDFEKYYDRAMAGGVNFIRSRIHSIKEVGETGSLEIAYVTESGESQVETFDLVILSVGMEPSDSVVDIAEKSGIELNKYNFVKTDDITPVSTSRPGIYVAGVIQGCKDIPQSVVEASAAACAAGISLAPARGSLVKEKEFPKENDVAGQEPRIGVFVCNCGTNIGGIADVPDIVEYAKGLPGVVYVEDNLFTCSQDTQEKMVEVIKENKLNRIVVAACTPRTHEPLFQETMRNSGLNPYLFEMANIRNQCTWCHSDDGEKATEKSKDLVRMAVARASLLESVPDISIDIERSALVIGGGLAGMTAAISLADQGFSTILVEKSSALGGAALNITKTWQGQNVQEFISDLTERIENHPDIEVLLDAEVIGASGFVGNFVTEISIKDRVKTVGHGATIIATGGQALETDEYLNGKSPRVTRWHELENDPERLKNAKSVVFIQCVGSRNESRPYCSRICCTTSVSQAVSIKEQQPETDVYILYRDVRTFGEREVLYKEARARGVIFIRYSPDNRPTLEERDDGIEVTIFDPILQRDLIIKADLINLATAIEPSENDKIASFYKIPVNEEGFFMEAHAKLRPVDFASEGLFVCGLAHYPKSLDESIAQAQAAAGRATTVLSKSSIAVSPLVSLVDGEKCIGCGLCAEICAFGAITLEDVEGKGVRAKNIPASCKGCGLCAASCPQKAIDMLHFRDRQILASVSAAL